MSAMIKQYHKYVSLKKRKDTREKLRSKNNIITHDVIPVLTNPLSIYQPKSNVFTENYQGENGPRASVSLGVTHSKIKTKKHKIHSNAVPFGYTKKEYNNQLSKLNPPIIRATKERKE